MRPDCELWFHVPDLKVPVVHAADAAAHDPGGVAGPALHLYAQGRLRYLASNGRPALLIDPFDPHSAHRVYAVGHAHTDTRGLTVPAGPAAGRPRLLAVLPLTGPDPHASLIKQLFAACGTARFLAVTVTAAGPAWRVTALPRPRPPARWVAAHLHLPGLRHAYLGEIVPTVSWRGWCLPRFTPRTAATIAAEVNALPRAALRRGLTRLRLTEAPQPDPAVPGHGGVLTVGPDPDGFYRIGAGRWPWVDLGALSDLGWDTDLTVFAGPVPAGADPATVPAPGQLVYNDGAELTWRAGRRIVSRPFDDDGVLDPDIPPEPLTVDYRDGREARALMAFRAIEHLLRTAPAPTPTPPPRTGAGRG